MPNLENSIEASIETNDESGISLDAVLPEGSGEDQPQRTAGRTISKKLLLCALPVLFLIAGSALYFLDKLPVAGSGSCGKPKIVQKQQEAEKAAKASACATKKGGADKDDAAKTKAAESAAPKDKETTTLPAITDFSPGTVYSGTLGELTRLQAGNEVARATLSLREVQARIQDIERSMAEKAEAAREKTGSPGDGENRKAKEDKEMEELKNAVASLTQEMAALQEKKEKEAAKGFLVLSVQSQGRTLAAEIASRQGTYLVRAGDTVPGLGRIDLVSRSKVTADGKILPWR